MATPERQTDIFSPWLSAGSVSIEGLTARYSRHSYPRHFHASFVVQAIESGVNRFWWGGSEYTVGPGTLVIFAPGDIHTGQSVGAQPLRYRAVYPGIELMAELSDPDRADKVCIPQFAGPVFEDAALCRAFLDAHRRCERADSPGDVERMLCALGEIVSRCALTASRADGAGAPQSSLARVREYLNERLDYRVTLDELAAIAGVTRWHLLRSFTHEFGITPHDYHTSLRIERAKRLLAQRVPPAHVAVDTGFCDQSHLNRQFRRLVGATPGAYRDAHH